MKKLLLFLPILIFILLVAPVFLIPFTPDKLSSFYYRELTYLHIAKDLEKANDRDTIINIFKFVSDNLHSSSGYCVVDKNAFNDLIRGIAWCDQQGFLLMNLLNKVGINKTRLRDVQGHTYSEIFFDDKWAILDPYYGFIPLDSENKFLGITELKDNAIHDQLGLIEALKGQSTADGIFDPDGSGGLDYKLIYIPSERHFRYTNYKNYEFNTFRRYGFSKELLESYSNSAYFFFGKLYFNWVQDMYLKSSVFENMTDPGDLWIKSYSKNNQKSDESFLVFYKARNYDVANRTKKASDLYKEVIENYPNSYWSKEAKFHLGVLSYKHMDLNSAEALLNDLYYDTFPRVDVVGYYLGLISQKNNNYKEAFNYFSLSNYYHSKLELEK